MLSESELAVIQKSRMSGFGMYLQGCWMVHYGIVGEVKKGKFPTRQNLEEISDKMQGWKTEFDLVYLTELAEGEVNPLKEEQETWLRLSPDVEKFLKSFRGYVENYSPENLQEREESLQLYLDIWWAFLQEWRGISDSFKDKMEEVYSSMKRKGIRKIYARESQK